ncbi:hypothetical protein EA462_14175 [Natrarchaeobius halalkaliphilus]|uniref:Phage tail protein n=1 Tax=Natrarchaeobius halalkaliphilus TaxID=1679091 RepID=A0A3N6LLJ3_9EURY|nr:phage tail protein [Natrarchaeobius halalkaliphilus]RQG88000.1 hypothetical protein EA462_14175 [Natrarchaeobius halalkaliphilus]
MHDEFALFSAEQRADWNRWAGRNVDTADRSVTLATTPTVHQFPLEVECADFAPVPNGNLLLLGESGDLEVYLDGEDRTSRLDLHDSDSLGVPTAIGATRKQFYLIDGDGDVGVFSRRTRYLERTTTGVVAPVGAVGGERRLYVLDAGGDGDAGFVLAIEPGADPDVVARSLRNPLDLALDADDTLYVLDEPETGPVVYRSENSGSPSEDRTAIDLDLPDGFRPELLAAQTTEQLVLYGDQNGDPMVVVYDLGQNDVLVATELSVELTSLSSATAGTAGDHHRSYARTAAGRVWVLERDWENRKDPENTRYEGYLVGRFDSGERDLEWHRIAFDISRATSGNHVDVRYYASNEDGYTQPIADLPGLTDEHREQLRRVGIDGLWDVIEYTPTALADVVSDLSVGRADTWIDEAREQLRFVFENRGDTQGATGPDDLLLEDATGRYLHVMVRLVGNRHSSPQIHALEAYCPRQSYLRYLPDIYRQAGQRDDFLARYLSIFETVFTDIEANISRSTQYIDAYEIPKDYFPWLNRWFGGEAVLGRAWPETAQRELLERSTELYKLRGTRRGMLELIGLYFDHVEHHEPPWDRARGRAADQLTDLVEAGYLTEDDVRERLADYDERIGISHENKIIIREYSDVERIENDALRQQYADLFGHPRRFQVLIWPTLSDRHVGVIKTIINADKPVYSDVYVERLRQNFRVNTNTYLGINTYVPETKFDVETSTLGSDTRIQ